MSETGIGHTLLIGRMSQGNRRVLIPKPHYGWIFTQEMMNMEIHRAVRTVKRLPRCLIKI